MKLSSRLAKLKMKNTRSASAKHSGVTAQGPARWRWAAVAVGLFLALSGTWAALAIFVWEKLPAALIGKWEVQEGPMKGGTFDFFRDGNLEIRTNEGQQINASAAVDGKTLVKTTRNPMTQSDETHKSTIQELTSGTLVLELEKGAVLRMARTK